MLRCTYIILIQNNQDSIPRLVESLKKINGHFRKEYIFVDDGSSDSSLSLIKQSVNDLPRSTIITQEIQGSTVSINKALSLATGDYVHFVQGGEILHPDSTEVLMHACINMGTEVAIGLYTDQDISNRKIKNHIKVVDNPISEILANRDTPLKQLGNAGSLAHAGLIDRVGGPDRSIYTHNISLSLRCAKYTKFVLVEDFVTIFKCDDKNQESNFVSYNCLKSIYNFARENPEIAGKQIPELLKALSRQSGELIRKMSFSLQSTTSKYLKTITLERVLNLYKKELNRLF